MGHRAGLHHQLISSTINCTDTVGAITDFVLSATAIKIAATQQMGENENRSSLFRSKWLYTAMSDVCCVYVHHNFKRVER